MAKRVDAPEREAARALSAGERALWQAAMRDAKRLAPENRRAAEPAAQPAPPAPAERPAAPAPPRRAVIVEQAPLSGATAPRGQWPGVDARSAQRLRRGQIAIEGRIDLHGMREQEARQALDAFLGAAVHAGKRCVLVITGKGAEREAEGFMPDRSAGVLRRSVPGWLGEAPNRAHVIAYHPARPADGGSGALYVLFRRQR
jgi:DNA-nicking Smr family endonuclease